MTSADLSAEKFIEAYKNPTLSASDIATVMGWDTKNPRQRVQAKLSALRKRGYDIPPRGKPYQGGMSLREAQLKIDQVTSIIRSNGFLVIYDHNAGEIRAVAK